MTRPITLSTCLFLTLLASGSINTASAQGIQEISWLAGEIRGQMAVVTAQAEATLCDCDDYDDVQDELSELCEKMDRFEQLLTEPIRSNQQIRRLRKAADRVDDQAEEVIEEIEDALEDLRDDRPRNRHNARHYGHRSRIDYGVRTQHYMLPPRYVSANQFGFTTPNHRVPSYGQFASYGRSYRSSGIQITLGGGRPRVQLVSTPTHVSPYHVGHPILNAPNGDFDNGFGSGFDNGFSHGNDFGVNRQRGNPAADALCAEAERLHTLTCQLVRSLR